MILRNFASLQRVIKILEEVVASIHPAGAKFTNNIKAFAESGFCKTSLTSLYAHSAASPTTFTMAVLCEQGCGYAIAFDGKLLENVFITSRMVLLTTSQHTSDPLR